MDNLVWMGSFFRAAVLYKANVIRICARYGNLDIWRTGTASIFCLWRGFVNTYGGDIKPCWEIKL